VQFVPQRATGALMRPFRIDACIHRYTKMHTDMHTGYRYRYIYIRILLLNPYADYFKHLYECKGNYMAQAAVCGARRHGRVLCLASTTSYSRTLHPLLFRLHPSASGAGSMESSRTMHAPCNRVHVACHVVHAPSDRVHLPSHLVTTSTISCRRCTL